MPSLLLLAPLVALATGAGANAELARAEGLLADLKYAEASSALSSAWAKTGSDRATVLTILELDGAVAGMLNQPERARAILRRLFLLDPEHSIDPDLSPRVRTPMYEAKAWAAEQGPLRAEVLTATV